MPLRCALLATAFACSLGAQSPLTALNDAFRADYAEAKQRVLAGARPVLVVAGDSFTLLRSGDRRLEASGASPAYDPLKTIAHIPLAVYVILTPGEGELGGKRLQELEQLRALIPPAVDSLKGSTLPASSLERQKRMTAECLGFIDSLVARRRFERSTLEAFTRHIAPLVMENVAEATRGQLDAVHKIVSAWRHELSPEEWDRLRVVIEGPHMPREDLVVTQYFLRLLHESREGGRVIYAESLYQEAQALDLVGTHLLDGSVGDAFFGDAMRMHRDLLGDAAKEYLAHLLPDSAKR